jgi:hypothetical protein
MSRIFDYNSFSSGKVGSDGNKFTFGCDLSYIDIDIINRPEEYEELSDAKCFIEYSVDFYFKKYGIDSIDFQINNIELNFEVDDYPNDTKEFDMDFIPGKTVDFNQIMVEVGDNPIPTYPRSLTVDMNKSTELRNYRISVGFGE